MSGKQHEPCALTAALEPPSDSDIQKSYWLDLTFDLRNADAVHEDEVLVWKLTHQTGGFKEWLRWDEKGTLYQINIVRKQSNQSYQKDSGKKLRKKAEMSAVNVWQWQLLSVDGWKALPCFGFLRILAVGDPPPKGSCGWRRVPSEKQTHASRHCAGLICSL